jgi:hypothetical protein
LYSKGLLVLFLRFWKGFSGDFRKPQYPHQNASDEYLHIVEEFLKGGGLGIRGLIDEQQLEHDEGQCEHHPAIVVVVNSISRELAKVFDPKDGQNGEQVHDKEKPNETRHLQGLKAKVEGGKRDLNVDQKRHDVLFFGWCWLIAAWVSIQFE